MDRNILRLATASVFAALFLVACGVPSPAAAPAPPRVENVPTAAPTLIVGIPAKPAILPSELKSQRNSEGSVTVEVIPSLLALGEPVAFLVAMNTHSVDLSDDLTKTSVLRDDAGKEYPPTGWEGSAAGGHHRSGTLTFAALSGQPKSVELIVKGLAGVPERIFKWELP